MDSKAELTETLLDEVVGGGVLLGDPVALAVEAGQLVEHGVTLAASATATIATAAVTYAAAGAAAIEDDIDRVLGYGGVGPTRRHATGF